VRSVTLTPSSRPRRCNQPHRRKHKRAQSQTGVWHSGFKRFWGKYCLIFIRDGDSRLLRKFGNRLPDYTVSQPRRLQSNPHRSKRLKCHISGYSSSRKGSETWSRLSVTLICKKLFLRFEILTTVAVKSTVIWDVTQCGLVEVYL
jgi:hypothetical protein